MGWAVTGPAAFLVSGLIDVALLCAYLLRRRWAPAVLALVILAPLLGPAAPARADSTEQSILMDDDAFIYASPAQVEANLLKIAALGVNTVKVSMVWSLVAPDPTSRTEPVFDATNPAAYPAINWARYDTLVEDAQALGLTVYFQLTAPAPLWATSPAHLPAAGYAPSNNPNPALFEQFVEAVGARYDGSYPVPTTYGASSGASTTQTITTPLGTYTAPENPTPVPQATVGATLPAVHEWGIWNEPNEVGWLSPQTRTVDGKTVNYTSVQYRRLVNAGYVALLATGHASDTILIGETASGGNTRTIPFLEDLYCVNAHNRPLRGAAAALLDCPTSGSRSTFISGNPGLFGASGYAHHPYSFNVAPNTIEKDPTNISTANLGVLEHELDAIFTTYGEPTGIPIYLTEYGYKTDPPNPTSGTTLGEQETWLDQADYMTYTMPRVKSLAQELLYDELPNSNYPVGSGRYWSTFDSGLLYHDGSPKPSLAAYRLPIWLPSQKTGSRRLVWAQIRPGPHYVTESATLEFEPQGSARWSPLAVLSTDNPEGYAETHVTIPRRGRVRLLWVDPFGSGTYYSRTVPIS